MLPVFVAEDTGIDIAGLCTVEEGHVVLVQQEVFVILTFFIEKYASGYFLIDNTEYLKWNILKYYSFKLKISRFCS